MHAPRRLALSLLVANLAAQTEPAAPVATQATPHVVIETVGPDGWRSRLGPTNVGSMLASAEGRAYWEPWMAPLFGMWRTIAGEQVAFEAARERVLGFAGSVRLALRFPADQRNDGPSHAALVLTDDGRSDLAALAKDVEQLLERANAGEWQQFEVAGEQRRMRVVDDYLISAPMLESDSMMLIACQRDDIGQCMAMARLVLAAPRTIGKPTPDSPALHVRFDMPALLADTGAFAGSDGKGMKALGFDSLQAIDVTLRAAGPHIALDVGVSFRNAEHGLFAAFMPDRPGVPALGQLLPAETTAFKVGRFDCAALFEAIVSAVEKSDYWADKPGEIRQNLRDEFGIDLGTDLLAHMTDEVLVTGSPLKNFDRAREATWLVAFRLRDEAKFKPGIEKVLASAKPFLSPSETTKVGDVEMRRYGNMLSYDLWLATGNGLFVIAGGRDAEDEAKTMLGKAAAQQELKPISGQEPWFAGLTRYLPQGHNGIARADLDSIGGMPTEWWFELLEAVLPMMPPGTELSPEEAEEAQERFRQLLRDNELTVVRTATGYADARWHWRLFW